MYVDDQVAATSTYLTFQDNLGRITKRIVKKTIKHSPQTYTDPFYCYRINGVDWPREAYCQRICTQTEPFQPPNGSPDFQNILRLFSWQMLGFPYYEWRLYTEYARFETLNDLIGVYAKDHERIV